MVDRHQLEAAVRRLDDELRRLTTPGIALTGPGLLQRAKEYADRQRQSEPERSAARLEADALVPELLDLYTGTDDGDREWIRGLLRDCPNFRWACGWGMAGPKPPVTAERALRALALFSIKDGEKDPRDQWVWLQSLCANAQKSGLDVPVLLRQAAEWSSDTMRFPPAPSTRALLLQFAERFTS